MIQVRSMATSPEHQESGNASSHPNRALALPPASIQQQLQSMAVAMVDLTQQNQELTKKSIEKSNVDIDVSRNLGRTQRMKGWRTRLKEEINSEAPLLEGCHI